MAAAAKIPTAAEIIQMKIKALLSDATEVATSWKLAHSVVIDGEGQFIDQVRAHKAWKDDSYIELFCFAGIHLPFLVHFTLGHGNAKGQELVGEITATIQKHYPDAVFNMNRGWNANWVGKTGKNFIEYVNKNQPGNTVSEYCVRPYEDTVTVYYEIACPQGCKDPAGECGCASSVIACYHKAKIAMPCRGNNDMAYSNRVEYVMPLSDSNQETIKQTRAVNPYLKSANVIPVRGTSPPSAKTLREELDDTLKLTTSPFWMELTERISDHLHTHWCGASNAITGFPIHDLCVKYHLTVTDILWKQVFWKLNTDPFFDTFIFSHHGHSRDITIDVKE